MRETKETVITTETVTNQKKWAVGMENNFKLAENKIEGKKLVSRE